jgi:hypothetical protein
MRDGAAGENRTFFSSLSCPRRIAVDDRDGPQEWERAYILWKARQVDDAGVHFAATDGRTRGEVKRRRMEAVPALRGRAATGVPAVSIVAVTDSEEGRDRASVLEHAVHSLKPGVFEELMEMMG